MFTENRNTIAVLAAINTITRNEIPPSEVMSYITLHLLSNRMVAVRFEDHEVMNMRSTVVSDVVLLSLIPVYQYYTASHPKRH
jgi:hypothetical protein